MQCRHVPYTWSVSSKECDNERFLFSHGAFKNAIKKRMEEKKIENAGCHEGAVNQ